MKSVRSGIALSMFIALVIAGTVIIMQQNRIRNLVDSRRSLAALYERVCATNVSLLSLDAARNDEILELRRQISKVPKLQNQLRYAQQQPPGATSEERPQTSATAQAFSGSLTREQLKFAGFDTPENAFQSLYWAEANGDYTNFLAALSPDCQQEELANPDSVGQFERALREMTKRTGIQILASKPTGNESVELKVQLDTENSAAVLIFPMVAIGKEWRLGGEIHSYTRAWDSPGSSQ